MPNDLPGFQDFMRPLLELLAKEAAPLRAREVYPKLALAMALTDAQIAHMLPSGKQTTFRNRVGWASTYLRFAGLVVSPSRGIWAISEPGRKVLATHKGRVDLALLETLPAYQETRKQAESAAPSVDGAEGATVDQDAATATPEEQLYAAHAQVVGSVAEELAKLLQKCDPAFFEELVIDLLGRMGYGTEGSRVRVGQAGDGGIDGVISLDKLGLEKIYIQAKRWGRDRKVGRPEIQAFFGALAGQRATKGLFMTTALFTQEAVQYAANVSGSLILVDGNRLLQLMIEHGVGVAVAQTLTVPKIDYDYFEG